MNKLVLSIAVMACAVGLLAGQTYEWSSKVTCRLNAGVGGQIVWCGGDTVIAIDGRGNGTYQVFNIGQDTWTSGAYLGYYPGAGAAAVWTRGDSVYILNGSTSGYFYRLYVRSGGVTARASLPVNVAAGGAACWAGGDTIYAIIGNATTSFYKYSISGNSWRSGTAVPSVPDYGCALAWAGGDTLYALRGGTTRQVWAYSLSGGNWVTKGNAPSAVGPGAALVWNHKTGTQATLFALAGGNTTVAWSYGVTTGAWSDIGALPVTIPNQTGGSGPLGAIDPRDDRMHFYVYDGYEWFLRGAPPATASLPLDESFEGSYFPPAGWFAEDTLRANYHYPWVRRQSGTNPSAVPYDGVWMATWPVYSSANSWSRLRTARLDAGQAYTAVRAEFRMYQSNVGYTDDSLMVEFSTTGATYSQVAAFQRRSASAGWAQKSVLVATAVRDTFYVAFRARAHLNTGYNEYIDSVRIFAVPYPDVGATAITAPSDTVPPGQLVFPMAKVRNFGTVDTSFYVKFQIGGAYLDSQLVASLAPTDSAVVGFQPWNTVAGNYSMKCYTTLAGDMNRADDTVAHALFVSSPDVATLRILSPTGTVDSGASVTPQARVRNLGNVPVSFPVQFRIGSFYADSATVNNLNPGDSATVSFGSWTALQRGAQTPRCSTMLGADVNHANDALNGAVTVRVRDVGCLRIVAPAGLVDSGTNVTPQAWAKNHGTTAEAPSVLMRIGGSYANSQTAPTIQPGDSTLVSFASWLASPNGTYPVRCSTTMAGDMNTSNDRVQDSAVVSTNHPDAAVIALGPPSDTVDSGTVVTPQARVRNLGNRVATFPAIIRIGSGYCDTMAVSSLAPGDSQVLSFRDWHAGPRGPLAVRCTVALAGDQNPANDFRDGLVEVRVIDAVATAIVAPVGTIDSGTVVVPRATVRNAGTGTAAIPVRLTIGDFYSDDTAVTLAAGVVQTIGFEAWTANELGTSTVSCTTMLAGDMDPGNDLVRDTVRVLPLTGTREAAGSTPGVRVFALGPALPSPLAGRGTIRFAVPEPGRATLRIYSTAGERIRTLVSGWLPAGTHNVSWDGADDAGRTAAPGCYFCTLAAGGRTAELKLLLAR